MVRMSNPKMDVIRFSEADVIVASLATTLNVSGIHDTTAKNATFATNNGHTYINDGTLTRTALFSALSADFGYTITEASTLQNMSGRNIGIGNLLIYDDEGRQTKGVFDGTFRWDNDSNGFVRN